MTVKPKPKLLRSKLTDETLGVFVLNVGDGDAIVIRFPKVNGRVSVAVVDCYDAKKTCAAIEDLGATHIEFVCATHPHFDHTKGILALLEWAIGKGIAVEQFWDSGFRHVSKTHYDIIRFLQKHDEIRVVRPTSGYETVCSLVRVLVLSPSIYLKNRYDTFGTNINNASIVLKLEYPPQDVAPAYLPKASVSDEELERNEGLKRNTLILAADAQFDAWARITQEFPELVDTDNRLALIDAKKRQFRPLRCQVLKAPHHMSKHGVTLEVMEALRPRYTIASCASRSRHGFPHELTVLAVEDLQKKKKDSGLRFTGHRKRGLGGGTIATLCKGNGSMPVVIPLGDGVGDRAPL